jgi:cobalt/nickel transport system permease protein
MHVPDGFLSPQVTVPALALAAPLWALASRRHLGRDAVDRLPVVGALTALAFVVQTIMIPVPGGTSVHLVGVMLLALLHDPLLAFVCESLVLVVQALFFGAGGVTVLGVNALAMGLLGPLAGWLAWRLLRPLSARLALFGAGWASTQVSTAGVVGALVLQHHLDPSYFPTPPAVVVAGMMIPSLAVAGVAEGLYTVFAFTVLERAGLTTRKGST